MSIWLARFSFYLFSLVLFSSFLWFWLISLLHSNPSMWTPSIWLQWLVQPFHFAHWQSLKLNGECLTSSSVLELYLRRYVHSNKFVRNVPSIYRWKCWIVNSMQMEIETSFTGSSLWFQVGLKYNESVVIRATGCPNGCARPYMAELGFVGDGPNSYQVYQGLHWCLPFSFAFFISN